MLRNYLKIAWRNLLKNKTYSLINILGLTVGIACFLVIALYLFDELTYDNMHSNAGSIYRVNETRTSAEGKETTLATTAYQVAEQAPASVPGVKNAARLFNFGRSAVSNPQNRDNTFYEDLWYTNPHFLEIFDFQLVKGDRSKALTAPYTVILTEEMALKLYGTTDVVGKQMLSDRDTVPFTITGVLKNFPSNSHIALNLLYSENSLQSENNTRFFNNDWSSSYFGTYFLLDKKADPAKIAQSINRVKDEHRDANSTTQSVLWLQPLKEIHFNSADIEQSLGRGGNKLYVYIFSIVGLFVLLIASINYMNLTTARFTNRAKEIAVRKVAGAARKNLVAQFLSEAMLLSIIAVVLAIGLVKLFLPTFNGFTEKQLYLGFSSDYRIWLGILVIVAVVGLLSGIYPALIQSRFKPFQLLKNKISLGKGNLSIRQGLVVFQFSLSIIMIAATLVVYLQLKYVNNKDMGFNKEQLLVMDINSGAVRRGAETIKSEMAKIPSVKSVTVSSRVPGEWKEIPKVKVTAPGASNTEGNDMYFLGIDENFLSVFEMEMLSGNNFEPGSVTDSSAVLLNESAANLLGITNAENQLVEIPSVDFYGNISTFDQPRRVRIKGIVKNFNFQSLRLPLAPMLLAPSYSRIHNIDYFTARLTPGTNTQETLNRMEGIIHSVDAAHLFEYHFLDKQWELFYREDHKRQTIFIAIAILTIIIACLGLFGLATYAAEQRIKEIGIRKVLGASVSGIVMMLSKDFVKLVVIASVIALPVTWWAMHNWLKDFAYRIQVSWWIFAAAGLVALLIALITISFQAIKAAMQNPVKSLRSE